jgi:Zn-dependent protease with chaperone function
LFTGLSARIRDWAARLGRKWFFTVVLYFIIYLVINVVLHLPLSFYAGYVREHAYGLSNQTAAKWLSNELKGLLVGAVIGSMVIWVPYGLLSRSPRRWWLYTGLLSLPFMLAMMLFLPIWIAPLFNKFGPMKDKALEAKILALAERAGIEGSRVFEVDKSTDTKKVNAYVVGVGSTKRIVLWDTLLAKANEDEVLFIMGHEMGHYVLGHVWQDIWLGTLFVTLVLFLIHRTADWLIRRFHRRFGFERLADIASLPLIVLLFSLAGLLAGPVMLAYSRHVEHEADRFGLEITRDNHAAASAFAKLQVENLGVPRPGWLYKVWRATHPPVGERIDFCNDYRPWQRNQPLVYGKYFREKR